jgi:hypothetical protein
MGRFYGRVNKDQVPFSHTMAVAPAKRREGSRSTEMPSDQQNTSCARLSSKTGKSIIQQAFICCVASSFLTPSAEFLDGMSCHTGTLTLIQTFLDRHVSTYSLTSEFIPSQVYSVWKSRRGE